MTVAMDTPSKTDEEAETSRRAGEGVDEGQPPPHPPDKAYPSRRFTGRESPTPSGVK